MVTCWHRLGLAFICLAVALPAYAQDVKVKVKAGKDLRVRGEIVRMQAPDRFIVRTSDNKEITFVAIPETRIVVNKKAARFSDLKVGAEINAVYTVRDDRFLVSAVTVGEELPAPEPAPAEGTLVTGTVVRVVGQDQVIVKTAEEKEVIIYVAPQTKYVFAEQPGRFTDLRPGADIRIQYDVRDRRNVARSIIGVRRSKK
jgi:translation initiation factor IF-1